MENVVIAGAGCAGLTAAIYTSRAMLNPLVFEGLVPGGQIVVSNEVENYPGFPEPISGMDLMQKFRAQAERFGARFERGVIEAVDRTAGGLVVRAKDKSIETRTLIIATGATARRLGVPGEEKFYGSGVSGCATCDGFFFKDMDVVVVGGGNTAIDDAIFLTRFATRVTIVHRREYMRASPITIEKARAHPKIDWMIPCVVEEILGDESVTGLRVKNPETGGQQELACRGVFVAIGHDPETAAFGDLVELDEHGYIKLEGSGSQTSVPGVFACGDVCDPIYKQAVVAAGGGCVAAMDAQHYLEELESAS